MATTGAVLYLRPRIEASVTPGRRSGAVLFLSFRAATGVFTSVGVDPGSDNTNLRAFLPHSRQPVLNADGTMNPAWYRFFQMFVDVFLGGAGAYTLQDIIDAVTTVQSDATVLAATTAAVQQQAQTNAEALAAARQVILDNSLTGASAIPEVQIGYTSLP